MTNKEKADQLRNLARQYKEAGLEDMSRDAFAMADELEAPVPAFNLTGAFKEATAPERPAVERPKVVATPPEKAKAITTDIPALIEHLERLLTHLDQLTDRVQTIVDNLPPKR